MTAAGTEVLCSGTAHMDAYRCCQVAPLRQTFRVAGLGRGVTWSGSVNITGSYPGLPSFLPPPLLLHASGGGRHVFRFGVGKVGVSAIGDHSAYPQSPLQHAAPDSQEDLVDLLMLSSLKASQEDRILWETHMY